MTYTMPTGEKAWRAISEETLALFDSIQMIGERDYGLSFYGHIAGVGWHFRIFDSALIGSDQVDVLIYRQTEDPWDVTTHYLRDVEDVPLANLDNVIFNLFDK